MNTAILQSMLMRGANAIYEIEESILHEKAMIGSHKVQGTHKDFYEYRYKRLEKFRRELAALVKIQRALKEEIYFQHGSDKFFRKVAESVPNHE